MLSLPPAHTNHKREFFNDTSIVLLILLALSILWTAPTDARAQGSGRSTQGTGGNHIVTGYVFFPSGRRAEGAIQVKLQSYTSSELSVTADSSGAFTFTSLAPGNYTVIIDAGKEYEIARESVFIDTDVNLSRMGIPTTNASRRYTVMVHLQPKREERQRASVIDAALAAVPENARKLFEKGLEQSRVGDSAKAVDSLRAAIEVYPNFPLALNELGVQYLKLGKPDKAVDTLNAALKLDPEAFNPRLNLGIALLEAKHFVEAQAQLNEAVKRNTSAPTPHMYLGLVLVHLGNNDEAEKELILATQTNGAHSVPQAHYYLGGLYWKKRDYGRAVEQLETYLQMAPNAPDAERVRTTIKDLRTKM